MDRMKAGDLIFLTRRHSKPQYRVFISYMIALLTKFKGQKLNDAKVHSALIYEYNSTLYVRDMDKDGDDHYTLDGYKEIYGERIEIVNYPFKASKLRLDKFNESCRNHRVKYDFWNTFFFQVIYRFSGFFIGNITTYHRMCAEDVQRELNILKKVFLTPEKTNPNELYKMVKGWVIQ